MPCFERSAGSVSFLYSFLLANFGNVTIKKKIMKKESSSIFSHVGLVTLAMIFSTGII